MVYQNHWLLLGCDLQVILLEEVFGNTNLFSITHVKETVAWASIKFNILDHVGSLVSVVGDDTLVGEFISTSILECCDKIILITVAAIFFNHLIIDLINPIKDSLG